MDLQTQFNELDKRLVTFIADTKTYFGQLNELEKYGWIGEGVGFLFVVAGIVFFLI